MKNFKTVYSAWDGNKLVGMICAMDDGIMNAYVHYLLVNPEYHGKKIGRTLVDMVKQHYKDYLRIAVIAYDKEAHFYENCGLIRVTMLLLCLLHLCGLKPVLHPQTAHNSTGRPGFLSSGFLGFLFRKFSIHTLHKFLNQRLIIKTIKYMHQSL